MSGLAQWTQAGTVLTPHWDPSGHNFWTKKGKRGVFRKAGAGSLSISWELASKSPPRRLSGEEHLPWQGAVIVSSSPLRFGGGVPDVEGRSRAQGPTKPQAARTPAPKGHLRRETRTCGPGSSAPEQGNGYLLLHTGCMAGRPEMSQDEHVSDASQVQSGF